MSIFFYGTEQRHQDGKSSAANDTVQQMQRAQKAIGIRHECLRSDHQLLTSHESRPQNCSAQAAETKPETMLLPTNSQPTIRGNDGNESNLLRLNATKSNPILQRDMCQRGTMKRHDNDNYSNFYSLVSAPAKRAMWRVFLSVSSFSNASLRCFSSLV